MLLSRLWLSDFRCYESVEMEPAAGVTAVVGENGSGKTSLLEAVGWLATARSFRGAPDAALVREGSERGVVRGEVERHGRALLVEAEIAATGRNRIQVNRQAVPRNRALGETLRVTLFSPDDLELVKGGPAHRRRYLDDVLATISPRLAAVIGEYERVVRQRTALLRAGIRDADDRATLEVWDAQLVAKGAELVRGRLRLLERLEGPLAKAYADVAHHASSPGAALVSGSYEAGWFDGPLVPSDAHDVEAALADALEASRRREIDRGQTLVGPHRDDWHLRVAGLEARSHASQGEQRSLALGLRLAAHAVVSDVAGEPPVLLLDDVFSELDPGRAEALVAHLPAGQAIVTTASSLPSELGVDRTLVAHDRGLRPR